MDRTAGRRFAHGDMTRRRLIVATSVLAAVLGSLYYLGAWTSLPIQEDALVRMPGTQPSQGVNLEAPTKCFNCHAGYDQAVEPGFNWMGSMMAQSARDPIFWACLTVAAQDSVWALGNPNAGDLCERCHFPEGWLGGRSDPANASAMTGSDFNGIHCDFCHRAWDPFFEDTYNGTREGNDWIGYWDEAGNTGPGSGTLSQTSADDTYSEDQSLTSGIKLFSGQGFFVSNRPKYQLTYKENASGQYFISPNLPKRASFADAGAKHQMFYSRTHKSKYFCGTCHDVSNPVLANLGLSGLQDQSSGTDQISEQYSASRYFHVERTFSEFMLSAYGQQGGAATNPEFQSQGASTVLWAAKCQDCHMRDVRGVACNKTSGVLRPDDSTEHPHSGLPLHDLTGGNLWISRILASLDPNGGVYDATNAQLLEQGPSVLTLDLTAGETPETNGAALLAGSSRAGQQLREAATLKNLSYSAGTLSFRIQNNTAHKLISGFPEGRRMFVNIKAYSGGNLIYEVNPYDDTVGTLKGLPGASLGANEERLDQLVYEVHPKSSLTGEDSTFHFVLATGRYKDNRIPPKGFNIDGAAERLCEPVWDGSADPSYFTAAEYAGGYQDVSISIPSGADRVDVTLYYQGTSREYVDFLRREINGTGGTLSSPTPSGETAAYIIQTDPFFSQLKAWGETLWQLWYHNHGLDGSGVRVDGIVPYVMATASWEQTGAPAISFSPSSLSFPVQAVGTTSGTRIVKLTNSGTAALNIAAIDTSGAQSSDFSISSDCPISPGSSLAAGENCALNVTFSPAAGGPRKALLLITDDAAGSPQRVLVTGVGTAVSLSPSSWDFGNQDVGTSSSPQNVTLTNVGTSPVYIWGTALSGDNSGDFSQSSSCPTPPATLAKDSNCIISITFSPSATGTRTATLLVSEDGGGSPLAASLAGAGTNPGTAAVRQGLSRPTGRQGQALRPVKRGAATRAEHFKN
jgi:hypothetical protein